MATNFVSYANADALMRAIATKFEEVEGAYVFKGSVAFAGLPASLDSTMVGYVYNLNEEFTIDNRFVEYESGVTKKYPAGTNVAIADVGTASTPDLKFDVLAGFIDYEAINAKIEAVSALIAPEFLATETYAKGDLVTYEGDLYKFTAAHSGAWTGLDAAQVTVESLFEAVDARIDTVVADLAPAFDATEAYADGDFVTYGDQLYQFNAAHAAGAWTGLDVDEVTVLDVVSSASQDVTARIDTVVANFAPAFSTSESYVAGDVVVYEDELYRFTAAHSGAWDTTGADHTQITVADLPNALTASQIAALKALIGITS